jgi:hypothetical protein
MNAAKHIKTVPASSREKAMLSCAASPLFKNAPCNAFRTLKAYLILSRPNDSRCKSSQIYCSPIQIYLLD